MQSPLHQNVKKVLFTFPNLSPISGIMPSSKQILNTAAWRIYYITLFPCLFDTEKGRRITSGPTVS